MASVQEKIIKQVNFYFSDNNLPRDKFLSELTKKNEDGYCPIDVIASFKRIQQLTTDAAVVVESLRKSDFLSVSEDGKNVKRKTPLGENIDFVPRSVYVKGFKEDMSLESVEEFVNSKLEEGEKCLCVRMRRFKGGDKSGGFKGSVFLEFNSEATAERFNSAGIKLTEDTTEPLTTMMKAEYSAKKKAEYMEKKAQKASKNSNKTDQQNKKRDRDEKPEKEEEKEIVKDLILSISSLNNETSREDLREVLEKAGCTIGFVEYARNLDKGFVRLAEDSPLLATATAEKLTTENTEINGAKAVYAALTGDEETEYWKKVADNRKNAKKKHKARDGYRGGKR